MHKPDILNQFKINLHQIPSNITRFSMQIGLVREQVTVEGDIDMGRLKDIACKFVDMKFPECGFYGLSDKILLFRHVPECVNQNRLVLITDPLSEVAEGALVEVVLSAEATAADLQIRPHTLCVHSYRSPHFCDFCGAMLFGLVRQGLQCEGCGRNFHKRCARLIPNNCSRDRFQPHMPSPSASDDSVPHTFMTRTYKVPTMCQQCKKLLKGLFRQGLQCKDCKFNVHNKCAASVARDCPGEQVSFPSERGSGTSLGSSDELTLLPENGSSNGEEIDEVMPNGETEQESDAAEPTTPSETNPVSEKLIPVQRIFQSRKHTKRMGSTVVREGWMVHFTSRDSERKRHYWKLDHKSITLFKDDHTNNYYKELLLQDIISVNLPAETRVISPNVTPHVFEIHTNKGILFVGENPAYEYTQEEMLSSPESGAGQAQAKYWLDAIKQALLPITKHATSSSTTPITDSLPVVRVVQQPPTYTNGNEPNSNLMPSSHGEPMQTDAPDDISNTYVIFPDVVLGAGQFGTVFAGHNKMSDRGVAIKVIDKQRFPNKQEQQLKNEVAILQNINHPCIVILERMYETPERIFVVMERLQGDMLEMILSAPKGRLSERITKFLIFQILVALKHLNSKNIVHCDLKPENVLLASDLPFTQVKLCDFGYSRIIGEHSFRDSIVGTPAYVAPEVLRNKGYNRSLDMWSVGVIIYVSLSGTFPFNEDEGIEDQIHNATFMYPPNPWKTVSRSAIELINSLLQVKMARRVTAERAMQCRWLEDYQTWCDLRMLETNVGRRFLTYEIDDDKWEEYRIKHKLQAWEDCGHKGADPDYYPAPKVEQTSL